MEQITGSDVDSRRRQSSGHCWNVEQRCMEGVHGIGAVNTNCTALDVYRCESGETKICVINWNHQLECRKIKQAIQRSRQINRNGYINTCSWWREISRNLYHRTPAVAYLFTNVEGLPRVSVMLSIKHRTVSTPICTRLTGQRGYLTQGSTSEDFIVLSSTSHLSQTSRNPS
jgi:hypothetical protein